MEDFENNDPAYALAYPIINDKFKAEYGVSLGKIETVFYQVVAGVKYKITYSS